MQKLNYTNTGRRLLKLNQLSSSSDVTLTVHLHIRRGLLVLIFLFRVHLPWYLTRTAPRLLLARRKRPWYLMRYFRRRVTRFHLRPSIMYSRLFIIIMRAQTRLNLIINWFALTRSRCSRRRYLKYQRPLRFTIGFHFLPNQMNHLPRCFLHGRHLLL